METSFDHYSLAREAFASGQTYHVKCPLTEALQQLSNPNSNFVPTLDQSLSISLQCQLALLWSIAGHTQAASQLASKLKPLIERGFLALWTVEKEYDEEEATVSAALLMRALGISEMSCPDHPFFAYLYEKNPKIEFSEEAGCNLVLSNEVHAGSFRVGKVYVPAFGPQLAPDSFGVCAGENGWICAKAAKECWFELQRVSDNSFTVQSIANRSIPFAFYVRAQECQIGEKVFKPKSLQRIVSKESVVRFVHDGQIMELSCDRSLSMELIPLAGDSSFWGASFLLAFTIPPMSGKLLFQTN